MVISYRWQAIKWHAPFTPQMQRSGQLSLAIPLWVGTMSTGQRAVMLCDWGVKADMVLFAGNTV